MTKNKVFLNKDGVIEIHVVGDQTVASVSAMGKKVEHLCYELRAAGKPVLIVDNLLQMGQVPREGRARVVELGKTLDYDKLAMIGSGQILRLGANLLLRATGKGHQIRYFEDNATANEWLQS